jgi:hypothetical protein
MASPLRTPFRARSRRASRRKASVSWNCALATSEGWSFFTLGVLRLQASDFVGEADVFFGKALESAVIIHLCLDLRRVRGRNALTELFSVEKPLEDIVRAAATGLAWWNLKKLFAQRAAAQAIDALHLREEALTFLEKRIEIMRHGEHIVSIWIP